LARNGKLPVSAHIHFDHRFLFWPSVKVASFGACSFWPPFSFLALSQSPSQGTLWFMSHCRARVSMGLRFFFGFGLDFGVGQATIGLEVSRGHVAPGS